MAELRKGKLDSSAVLFVIEAAFADVAIETRRPPKCKTYRRRKAASIKRRPQVDIIMSLTYMWKRPNTTPEKDKDATSEEK